MQADARYRWLLQGQSAAAAGRRRPQVLLSFDAAGIDALPPTTQLQPVLAAESLRALTLQPRAALLPRRRVAAPMAAAAGSRAPCPSCSQAASSSGERAAAARGGPVAAAGAAARTAAVNAAPSAASTVTGRLSGHHHAAQTSPTLRCASGLGAGGALLQPGLFLSGWQCCCCRMCCGAAAAKPVCSTRFLLPA